MGQGANDSAAERSAGWFAEVFDHHPDGLLVADDQGLLSYVNQRAARIVGIAAPELLGQDIRKAIPLQEYDGRSWWDCTDPWTGLAIRSGHREKLLVIPGLHEVLVTAKYVRPGRGMPVSQVIVAMDRHAVYTAWRANRLKGERRAFYGLPATLRHLSISSSDTDA